MITSIPTALRALLFLTTLTTAQLVLSNLQNITGFSSQCTTAYDTPIPQCDPAHFGNGALCSCSSDCQAALGQLTGTITSACQGTSASDDTLLGLFFRNEGVGFLCNGGSGGGCGAAASSGASSAAPSSTAATSSSSAVTTTTSPSSSHTPSSIASSLVAGTSKARTTSAGPSSSSSTTTAATSSRSLSPLAQSGGGGSPFDISSDAARSCRAGGFVVVGMFLISVLLA